MVGSTSSLLILFINDLSCLLLEVESTSRLAR